VVAREGFAPEKTASELEAIVAAAGNCHPSERRTVNDGAMRTRTTAWLNQVLESESRQTVGAKPCARLKARLNASSDSYPTRRAIATIVASVVASKSSAMCIRQSVR
jgi:hypothetical protein